MEYKPRYPQPFTLNEAMDLDVSIITAEIARLQNSLFHLRQTQEALREHVKESNEVNAPDPEIVQAIEENAVVIGSQEERIMILNMALSDVSGGHYDVPGDAISFPETLASVSETPSSSDAHHPQLDNSENDDAVYL